MSTSRRSVLAATAPALAAAASAALNSSALSAATPAAADANSVVTDLVERATQAHVALMQGDLPLYRSFITHSADFTLMSPFGGKPSRGASFTPERWIEIGRFFRDGRDSTLELVEAYHTADMVVLAAIERTHVAVGDLPAQPWALRVTLVFRKDGDQWKQVHRHADSLVPGISIGQAAALTRGPASVQE
jgi:ketosteroid isomerase-like protein